MTPDRLPRASMRMPRYDYSLPGSYFVTFCTRRREELLARIEAEKSLLTPAGEAVLAVWESLPLRFPSVLLDEFTIMPNHVHAVIHLTDGEVKLGQVVRRLKAVSTQAIRSFHPDFGWQSDYYDRVVRSEYELARIRNYIISNPAM